MWRIQSGEHTTTVPHLSPGAGQGYLFGFQGHIGVTIVILTKKRINLIEFVGDLLGLGGPQNTCPLAAANSALANHNM